MSVPEKMPDFSVSSYKKLPKLSETLSVPDKSSIFPGYISPVEQPRAARGLLNCRERYLKQSELKIVIRHVKIDRIFHVGVVYFTGLILRL